MGMGILVGMPVFFEVGLVLLMPIVAEAARRSGRPPILVGIPLLAGLSIVHGTLPPHPAAMLAATQFHADLGRTILFGLAVGLPAATLAGPVLGWLMMRRWEKRKAKGLPVLAEAAETLFVSTEAEELEIEHRDEGAVLSPVTHTSGAEAPAHSLQATARLKSCPDTIRGPDGVFPQAVKSCLEVLNYLELSCENQLREMPCYRGLPTVFIG
jgi:hypothetical protein